MSEEGQVRTKRYDAKRQSERGETRVAVWVPSDQVEKLKRFAEKLRRKSGQFRQRTKKPPVAPPRVSIPVAPLKQWALIAIERDELAFQLILKANGAKWCSGSSTAFGRFSETCSEFLPPEGVWRIRADLVDRIGLSHRVAAIVDAVPARRDA